MWEIIQSAFRTIGSWFRRPPPVVHADGGPMIIKGGDGSDSGDGGNVTITGGSFKGGDGGSVGR